MVSECSSGLNRIWMSPLFEMEPISSSGMPMMRSPMPSPSISAASTAYPKRSPVSEAPGHPELFWWNSPSLSPLAPDADP